MRAALAALDPEQLELAEAEMPARVSPLAECRRCFADYAMALASAGAFVQASAVVFVTIRTRKQNSGDGVAENCKKQLQLKKNRNGRTR